MTNTRFPGLPDYTGPDSGIFYGVHHEIPYEYSHSIKERLDYIDNHKPEHERATRRRHICLMLPEDGGVPIDVMNESYRLLDESNRLWAESNRLGAESQRLWSESNHLWTESYHLGAESKRRWAESNRLLNESNRRWDDSSRLLSPYRNALIRTWKELVPDNKWDGSEIIFPETTP